MHSRRSLANHSARQAPTQSPEVRINGNAWDSEGMSQHDIRGFTPHSWKRDQLLQSLRDLTSEIRFDLYRQAINTTRLGSKESSGVHEFLNVGQGGIGEFPGCSVLPKKGGSHPIDTLIGALGRENCRHEELQGILKIQFAMHLWVGLSQDPVNRTGTLHRLRIILHLSEVTRFRARGETLLHFLVKSPRDSRRSDCSPRTLIYCPR